MFISFNSQYVCNHLLLLLLTATTPYRPYLKPHPEHQKALDNSASIESSLLVHHMSVNKQHLEVNRRKVSAVADMKSVRRADVTPPEEGGLIYKTVRGIHRILKKHFCKHKSRI